MATTFDTWLAALAAAGKGGFMLPNAASRGRKYAVGISVPGNFTGATMRAAVRSSPDAGGAALATFTVTGPVVSGGNSLFTLALAAGSGANSTGSLPADGDGDGVAHFPIDVLLTPSGGDEELLFGAALPVLGRITA